ncbi:hypothetical protein BZA70DRAFT_266988 [Myxozyma melibiosi]|uniref:C3H1-type domain-containing protein n=1 Tax=Myxozyma melibiosi TaxID=54550 RepID=A0ABR1F9X1_9ASCO
MSDAELLKQIASLAGAINRHKNGEGATSTQQSAAPYPTRGSYYPNSRGSRGSRGRGRASSYAYRSYPHARHQNRTLVLSDSKPTTSGSGDQSSEDPVESSSSQYVKKRDRHMQLINKAVYSDLAEARAKALEKTRLAKQSKLENRAAKKAARRAEKLLKRAEEKKRAKSVVGAMENVEIDGVKYAVQRGGNKLIRVTGNNAMNDVASGDSPKKAVVGGVTFLRSRNGNLWRKGVVQNKGRERKKIDTPCRFFTMTGTCARGLSCPYTHSPTHVALCPLYLQNKCKDPNCDLSHNPTPHNAPLCHHFQRGNCSNPNCQYSHMKLAPDAKICNDFATTGYCDKGAKCKDRHVFECPEFERTGKCSKAETKGCKLKHVFRAGAGKHVVDDAPPSDSLFFDDHAGASDAGSLSEDVFNNVREHLKRDAEAEAMKIEFDESEDDSNEDDDDNDDGDMDDVEFDSDQVDESEDEEDMDTSSFTGDAEYIKV